MLGIGFGEFALVLVVLIVVLGPERLPTFMKAVGKGIRTLRNASRDIRSAVGIDELMREDFTYRPPPRRPDPPRDEPPVSHNAELPAPEQPAPAAAPDVDEGAKTLLQAPSEATPPSTAGTGKAPLGRTQFSPGAPPPPSNPTQTPGDAGGTVPRPPAADLSGRISAPAPPKPGFPRPAHGAVSRADVPEPPPSAPPPAPPPSGAPPAPSEDEK